MLSALDRRHTVLIVNAFLDAQGEPGTLTVAKLFTG